MKVPSQYTTIYTPAIAGRVEKPEGQNANASFGGFRGTSLTFDQLKEKLRLAEADNRPKPDLKPKMNPALATAITAANSNGMANSLEVYSKSDVDIYHDNAKARGLTENIEV
jgi:hypothetical protein